MPVNFRRKWVEIVGGVYKIYTEYCTCDVSSITHLQTSHVYCKVSKWWRDHIHELPFWSKAYKSTLLIQPSSVFSLLANSFKEHLY